MIVLVGGAGFIGTRLATLLKESGREFIILDKRRSRRFPDRSQIVDITDLSALSESLPKCTSIINLAAEHRDNVKPRSRYDTVNVEGAKNICAVASGVGAREIVFTSTVAVYGFAPPNTAEDGSIAYFNDYGRTKWQAEQVYREWQYADRDRRALTIVRPTVVFGEDNRGNVYNLLRAARSPAFMMIGAGTNKKSLAYVENVAAFLMYVVDSSAGYRHFNYVDKPDLTTREIVDVARRTVASKRRSYITLPKSIALLAAGLLDILGIATGRTFPLSRIRVRKFCATTQFSSSVPETGFRPPWRLTDALERTVEYEFGS